MPTTLAFIATLNNSRFKVARYLGIWYDQCGLLDELVVCHPRIYYRIDAVYTPYPLPLI